MGKLGYSPQSTAPTTPATPPSLGIAGGPLRAINEHKTLPQCGDDFATARAQSKNPRAGAPQLKPGIGTNPCAKALGTILLFVLLHDQALAETISNLRSMPIFFICLAQGQESADAFWRHAHASMDPAYQQRLAWIVKESSWAACVK